MYSCLFYIGIPRSGVKVRAITVRAIPSEVKEGAITRV